MLQQKQTSISLQMHSTSSLPTCLRTWLTSDSSSRHLLLSQTVSRAYSKAVQIGAAREVVDEMINIKDDYEAVHGAVTEAAPKVFLKYFYVNTKTGEKSGEMLATVKLG